MESAASCEEEYFRSRKELEYQLHKDDLYQIWLNLTSGFGQGFY